jgi:uncharacterized protein (TIGR03435 family)
MMVKMSTVRIPIALLFAGLTCAWPQKIPKFEVATVKLAPPRTGTAGFVAMDTDPAMIHYANITLKNLIAMAYRIDSERVLGGPQWLDTQMYDLAAKLPPNTPKDRVPAMLQALLAERFKLAVHRESKEQRVYFLVVGKGGPKLKDAQPEEKQDLEQVRGSRLPMQMMRGRIVGRAVPVAMIAGALSRVAGYPVVDHTGLTNTIDVDLKWTPEDNNKGDSPNLFAAIQEQLGLKLEPGKAPVEMLIVDGVERTPAEN